MTQLKLIAWVAFGFVVAGIAFWFVTSARGPANPFLIAFLAIVFVAAPCGTFWMLYMSIRYEKRPLPTMLLAFIPYTFLWYYFERVRSGRLTTNRQPANGSHFG